MRRKLREAEVKLQELRQRRDELNEGVGKLSLEIRSKKEKLKELRNKYDEVLREKNDAYLKLTELKNKRKELLTQMKGLKEESARLKEENRFIRGNIGAVRRFREEELKSKLNKLEWEYQTRPINLEEDKFYINKIRNLEALYLNVKKYNRNRNRLQEIKSLMNSIRQEIEKVNGEIKLLSERYLSLKEKANQLKNERNKIREEINKLYERREELKRKSDRYHAQVLKKLDDIKNLREDIERLSVLLKAAEVAQKLEARKREKFAKAQRIYEKYRKGGKLSLEEFRLLVEFDMLHK